MLSNAYSTSGQRNPTRIFHSPVIIISQPEMFEQSYFLLYVYRITAQ